IRTLSGIGHRLPERRIHSGARAGGCRGVRRRTPLLDERRAPAPSVVALRRLFDLDDVRARISQCLRAVGAGENACQIDDADAIQGLDHVKYRSVVTAGTVPT